MKKSKKPKYLWAVSSQKGEKEEKEGKNWKRDGRKQKRHICQGYHHSNFGSVHYMIYFTSLYYNNLFNFPTIYCHWINIPSWVKYDLMWCKNVEKVLSCNWYIFSCWIFIFLIFFVGGFTEFVLLEGGNLEEVIWFKQFANKLHFLQNFLEGDQSHKFETFKIIT